MIFYDCKFFENWTDCAMVRRISKRIMAIEPKYGAFIQIAQIHRLARCEVEVDARIVEESRFAVIMPFLRDFVTVNLRESGTQRVGDTTSVVRSRFVENTLATTNGCEWTSRRCHIRLRRVLDIDGHESP